jgi:putative phosphoribosyl transferase
MAFNFELGSRFKTRTQAGELLSVRLQTMLLCEPIVLAVPRGGLPIAKVIARLLEADLDIAAGPEAAWPESAEFASVTADTKAEATGFTAQDRDVLIVDDGVMTGTTVLAAAKVARAQGAARIVIATPVISTAAVARLAREPRVELVALLVADSFTSLTEFFEELTPVKDIEVHEVRQSALLNARHRSRAQTRAEKLELRFDTNEAVTANLLLPEGALAVILGAGLDALDVRQRLALERSLTSAGFGFLDCEKSDHEGARESRHLIEWLAREPAMKGLPIGIFAIGESCSHVLEASASVPELVRCLVCLDSGQLDSLAHSLLEHVMAATLFIDGEKDKSAIQKNRKSLEEMSCQHSLALVAGSLRGELNEATFAEIESALLGWLKRFLSPELPTRGADIDRFTGSLRGPNGAPAF